MWGCLAGVVWKSFLVASGGRQVCFEWYFWLALGINAEPDFGVLFVSLWNEFSGPDFCALSLHWATPLYYFLGRFGFTLGLVWGLPCGKTLGLHWWSLWDNFRDRFGATQGLLRVLFLDYVRHRCGAPFWGTLGVTWGLNLESLRSCFGIAFGDTTVVPSAPFRV